MDWTDKVTQVVPEEVMLPAVGQGALAVQCRRDDQELLELLAEVNDPVTERAVTAERTFLQAFEGGCHLPIAGRATVDGERIRLRGLVAHPSGTPILREEAEGADPVELGRRLARELMEKGARSLLEEVKKGLEE